MQAECDHRFVVVATFEATGCKVMECSTCGQTSTTWITDYSVPVDPMDSVDTECCQ